MKLPPLRTLLLTMLLASIPCGDRSAYATQPASAPAGSEVAQVDACSLLSRAEVETITGRSALDPVGARAAELSTCDFGDPEAPKLGGRPLAQIARIAVFSGGTSYHAGPVAQAASVYETAEKGAGGAVQVAGIGEKAHWSDGTLRVLRGPYLLEVEVEERGIAEKLAAAMLKKLP